MSHTVKINRKADQKTTEWSGGTTTELAIFPVGSDYHNRNFSWRLSSAKVLQESSVFTELPGIARVLMVLDGEMILKHQGRDDIFLKPFEQDAFMGDWKSESRGRVTDFNLMTRDNCMGYLEPLSMEPRESSEFLLKTPFPDNNLPCVTEACYVFRGDVEVTLSDHSYILGTGDIILIQNTEKEKSTLVSFENRSMNQADIVRCVVYHELDSEIRV